MEKSKQKSILSYLYATSKGKDMKEIYEIIKNNKIECNDDFIERCQIIKDLFLKKIENGMDYDTYLKYKEAIKGLDTNTYYIYINNLIYILGMDKSYLNYIVKQEYLNGNYNCLKPGKNNENVNISHVSSIDILKELYGKMKLFVANYVKELTKDYPKEYIAEFYNQVIEHKEYYEVILTKAFTNEFNYLENTIYKSLYLNFFNNLSSFFRSYLKSVYNNSVKDRIEKDMYKFYNHPRQRSQGYGYYKKFKDYRR